ncbi:DUF6279 family lipoprotein [Alteromonas sp. H39]|uniref:DUF6279 family lipoprotein n=1 Tax=Alteromonas sp. H39 TaxID=3389876 RepID=UPI0039E1D533
MKKSVIFALLVLLGGCSSKLAYNNLDWLIYWYMDDYVELTDKQENVFDHHLESWIDWHRDTELTRYIAQLNTLKSDISNDQLTEQTINQHLEQATSHWIRVREKLSPGIASMATTLTDEQVVRLFAALEKDNKEEEEEYLEDSDKSAQEKAEERLEDITDDIEDRIGSLTNQQEAIIARYSPQFASTYQDWIAYQRAIQDAARKVFITRDSNPDFTQDLMRIMNNPDVYRSDAYLQKREQNRRLYASMAAELSETLTSDQKRKLLKKIQDIIDDLNDLVDD